MLVKHSTIELHPQPFVPLYFETGSLWAAQMVLENTVYLYQALKLVLLP